MKSPITTHTQYTICILQGEIGIASQKTN